MQDITGDLGPCLCLKFIRYGIAFDSINICAFKEFSICSGYIILILSHSGFHGAHTMPVAM